MNTDLLLGIAGTLLGTIIGWMLNNISNAGRLNVFISEWTETFQYNNKGYMKVSTSMEQTSYYQYTLEIDIYNSSTSTKIMRNILINFTKDKECIISNTPHDNATTEYRQHFNLYYDVEPINIPPKSVVKYKLTNAFDDEKLQFIWNTTKIELQYTNAKNKTKNVLIKKVDYRKYFETIKPESTPEDSL